MTQITPQPGILDIALYVGGASHLAGVDKVIKLSSNENPFGPSPAAVAAVKAEAARLHRYPSSDHASLRASIAAKHGLDAARIVCGAGSDEIIAFLCQAYAGPGDEVIHTEHGFAMYRISAMAAGATPVEVRERDRVVDVDAILEACNEKTRLVFIANPGNPTATMLPAHELGRLADGVPGHVIVVLDGAYAEYVEGFDGGAALVDARDNVVMTRTFSKLYGLGGMRVGWGYGPQPIMDVLNRIRGPFNLSSPALAAAEAALDDSEHEAMSRSENARLRVWLIAALARHGVTCDESHANFILARFGDSDEAEAADAFLQSRGIIVRKVAGYGLPEGLRITVGTEADCAAVADAIAAFREGRT